MKNSQPITDYGGAWPVAPAKVVHPFDGIANPISLNGPHVRRAAVVLQFIPHSASAHAPAPWLWQRI